MARYRSDALTEVDYELLELAVDVPAITPDLASKALERSTPYVNKRLIRLRKRGVLTQTVRYRDRDIDSQLYVLALNGTASTDESDVVRAARDYLRDLDDVAPPAPREVSPAEIAGVDPNPDPEPAPAREPDRGDHDARERATGAADDVDEETDDVQDDSAGELTEDDSSGLFAPTPLNEVDVDELTEDDNHAIRTALLNWTPGRNSEERQPRRKIGYEVVRTVAACGRDVKRKEIVDDLFDELALESQSKGDSWWRQIARPALQAAADADLVDDSDRSYRWTGAN